MKNKRIVFLFTLLLVLAFKSPLAFPVATVCHAEKVAEKMPNSKQWEKNDNSSAVKKTIDGDDKDWQSNHAYTDAAEEKVFPVDYQTVWFQQDSERIYFAFRNRIPIDEKKFEAWYVYIDSDVDVTTGYRINNLGADFLLEGTTLFKHTGGEDLWQWKRVGQVENAVDGHFAEFAIDRLSFSQSKQFKLLFYGANVGVSGNVNDTLPVSINLTKHSRVVDGSSSDWPLDSGYQDTEKVAKSPVDFTKAWFHSDNDKIYLAYRNRIPINPNQLWAWHIFIDKDAQSSTGFQSRKLGADFLLEGKTLFRYSGTGKEWQWQKVGEIEAALSGHVAEFAISRSVIKPSKEVKLLFYGSNAGAEGMTNDTLLVAIDSTNKESLEGSVNDGVWSNSKVFEDTQKVETAPVDFLSARFFQDSDKIYLSYCNRSKIDTNQWWAWHAYIDSDRQIATGYNYEGIGADFILEGNKLFKYTGSSEKNWQWEVVTEVESNVKEDFAEFAIDKKLFNQSDQYQFVLFGSNSALGEGVDDTLRIIP
ncbi:MAG: hypothetical protein V3U75_12105 [Methylococcaceae bacterium]